MYGRGQGDVVLTRIAQRLRSCIRSADLAAIGTAAQEPAVVARLGDSAFSVLIADLDSQEAASLAAQRLLVAVAQPIAVDAQHKFFDEALNARAKERMVLETELRQAIGAGQPCLHYQPKVDGRSGRLIGAEALVRWQHPARGLVPPGSFITLAEESGLIAPLTEWVLHAAFEQMLRAGSTHITDAVPAV